MWTYLYDKLAAGGAFCVFTSVWGAKVHHNPNTPEAKEGSHEAKVT